MDCILDPSHVLSNTIYFLCSPSPEAVETEAANHSHSLSCVGFETQVSDCSITNSTGRCIQPLLNEGVQCKLFISLSFAPVYTNKERYSLVRD